jgi:type VI protein secretion system component Hcp
MSMTNGEKYDLNLWKNSGKNEILLEIRLWNKIIESMKNCKGSDTDIAVAQELLPFYYEVVETLESLYHYW